MLIQFHILQTYGPSNLNRDGDGSPKNATFGDVLRGRISSQCLKRSIRWSDAFQEAFGCEFEPGAQMARATRRLPELLDKELQALGATEEERKDIVEKACKIGSESGGQGQEAASDKKEDEKDKARETRQIIRMSAEELEPLAQQLLVLYREWGAKKWQDKDDGEVGKITAELKKRLSPPAQAKGQKTAPPAPDAVDIALFGRMTTSPVFPDVRAAAQVAHALSVDPLKEDFDYYTAVDDLSGESGAGMIGETEFNSCTYYKYLNLHWEELLKNLKGNVADARKAALAYLEAACLAQPTGKQNAFAGFFLPDLILVEVRSRNLPVNYAAAFLRPVTRHNGQTVIEHAAAALQKHMQQMDRMYSLAGLDERAVCANAEYALPNTVSKPSLQDLQAWLGQQLPKE